MRPLLSGCRLGAGGVGDKNEDEVDSRVTGLTMVPERASCVYRTLVLSQRGVLHEYEY